MALTVNNAQQVPIEITGGSTFDGFNTVDASRTYNMYITQSADGKEQWLVNFMGYEAIKSFTSSSGPVGRGLFRSIRGGFIIAVIGDEVYRLNSPTSVKRLIGNLSTSIGEVSIDENLDFQICIVDGTKAYIYNYDTDTFGDAVYSSTPVNFTPNYVAYQNGFFLFGNANTDSTGDTWSVYASGYSSGSPATAFNLEYQVQLNLETKPDYALAVVPIPGASNTVLVLGSTVAEIWQAVPNVNTYQRNASINIDYGCASVSTIDGSDTFVVWLGINENSSPSLLVTMGGQAQRISTDGIDNLFDNIKHPGDSTGFLFREDGHLFYQLTFFNSEDNLSIVYDFNTKLFFDLTDWDWSYHPARSIVYFDLELYFVSLKDGKLYRTDSELNTATTSITPGLEQYEIPRARVTNTFRLPSPEKWRVNLFSFWLESGAIPNVTGVSQCNGYVITEDADAIIYTEDDVPIITENATCQVNQPRVDLRISKSGALNWSNTVSYNMRNTGQFKCQPRWSQLGFANQITLELKFFALGRVLIHTGLLEIGE